MILPSKHEHPDLTVVAVSAVLLKALRKGHLERYERLKERVVQYNASAEPLLLPALLFLYALGLVEYHSKTDSVVYTGKP